MLNENDKREAIRRILHDFVTLKLHPQASLSQVSSLLDSHTDRLMNLIEEGGAEFGRMKETLRGVSYGDGAAGLTNLVADFRESREAVESIRKMVGSSSFLPRLIARQVEEVMREVHERRNFDSTAHDNMREVLEDAGYSPDADGIKALLEELAERKRVTVYIEGVLDGVNPKLRQELPVERAVAAVGGELLRGREAMKSIHRITSAQLDR